jgi:hypothetical protein
MATAVVHHTRVAWDFAQVTVYAAEAGNDLFRWYTDRVEEVLGPEHEHELWETRVRLGIAARPDARQVEIARWWPRIEDILRGQPHLAVTVQALRDEVAARLASYEWPAAS